MDMLHGSITDKLIKFAIPVALTGIAEQLFNGADIMVLSHYDTTASVAAVGNNMPFISLVVMLLLGTSLGANVVIAQLLGKKDIEKAGGAALNALAFSAVLGILITVLGELVAEQIESYMGVPPDVMDESVLYFRIYLYAVPFISVYNFAAAISRSNGNSKTPFYCLLFSSLLNIVLDIIFAGWLHWGLSGVVWATVIAYIVNAVTLTWMITSLPVIREFRGPFHLDGYTLKRILQIGLPAGIQGMMFSVSNLLIQAAINSLGADAMAGSTIAIIIESMVYSLINSFGQAVTTFVGQNFGAGNIKRCIEILHKGLMAEIICTILVTGTIVLFRNYYMKSFTGNEAIIALGAIRIMYVTGFQWINGMVEVLSGFLRGIGVSTPPAVGALIGICGFRILWLYTLFKWMPGFTELMLSYPASWIVTVLIVGAIYLYYRRRLMSSVN